MRWRRRGVRRRWRVSSLADFLPGFVGLVFLCPELFNHGEVLLHTIRALGVGIARLIVWRVFGGLNQPVSKCEIPVFRGAPFFFRMVPEFLGFYFDVDV